MMRHGSTVTTLNLSNHHHNGTPLSHHEQKNMPSER